MVRCNQRTNARYFLKEEEHNAYTHIYLFCSKMAEKNTKLPKRGTSKSARFGESVGRQVFKCVLGEWPAPELFRKIVKISIP